jgi:diguanylate cyclase (GGDEF)-like protein/PAS domain S-box-containing protein
MMSHWSLMSGSLIAAGVISLGAAAFVLRHRGAPGRLSLSIAVAAGAAWSITYGLELAATSRSGQQLWGYAEYLGTTLLPPAWLLFALQYTGRRRRIGRSLVAALAVEPVIVLALIALPATRELVRSYPAPFEQHPPVVHLGPAYWLHFVYTSALVLAATVVLVGSLARISSLYWRQAAVLVAAISIPFVTNVLSSAQLGPFKEYDFTPLAFCVSSLAFIWVVFRLHLLDLVPVARAAVVDKMPDAMLVLDAYGRVVDVNTAGRRMLRRSRASVLGQPVDAVLPLPKSAAELQARSPIQIELWAGGKRTVTELVASPIRDRHARVAGQLLLLRDVTERARIEDEREALLRQLEPMLAHLPAGVVIAETPAGDVRAMNAQVGQILGGPNQLPRRLMEPGWRPDGMLRPDGRPYQHADELPLARSFLRGEVVDGEECGVVRCNGDNATLLVSSAPIRDAAGDVVSAVAIYTDITERKRSEQLLADRALRDPLTGLPNRLLLLDRLGHALAHLARRPPGETVAVVFFDLDEFKLVNDSLGHAAGDQLLLGVAARLRAVLRPQDTLARLGGDEFAVLCDGVDQQSAITVATRLADAFAEPFSLDGLESFASASFGIALARSSADTPEVLLRDADAAMYEAKRRGRGGYAVFDSSMRTRTLRQFSLERRLSRALERGELCLYYQPEIALTSGQTVGAEALLRWKQPNGLVLSPSDFLPAAESSGLIMPIGAWAIQEACRQRKTWVERAVCAPDLVISVNVSARQFGQPDLADLVASALQGHGRHTGLRLEITESVLIEHPGTTLRTLRQLRDLGVELALDDFGTGYSSLSYLKHLDVDILKIDQSFVRGLHDGVQDTAIVAAVIDLAHALDLRVVAEGVENDRQRSTLSRLACERAQGYYWSPPVEAAELESRLVSERS